MLPVFASDTVKPNSLKATTTIALIVSRLSTVRDIIPASSACSIPTGFASLHLSSRPRHPLLPSTLFCISGPAQGLT